MPTDFGSRFPISRKTRRQRQVCTPALSGLILLALLTLNCRQSSTPAPPYPADVVLPADQYLDKARGFWLASLIGNWTGLPYEGKFLDESGPDTPIEWALLPEYTTDDDTLVEWVDIHILEEHGLTPSYEQVRDEWVAHLNNDIWWANRVARDLMDQGILPPQTGDAIHNPHGGWNIDAQIESELFGVIAPAMPHQARDRAAFFARVTSHGDPVDTATFYAILFSLAFTEQDPQTMIEKARTFYPTRNAATTIAGDVLAWYAAHPDDWRVTRQLIRDKYDTDPGWNAARVNFASTLMALLYGQGDFERTVTIAALAGWDADCNATTAAGLIGTLVGYSGLPAHLRDAAGHVYHNIDVTGNLPQRETIDETAARLQRLAEKAIQAGGGWIQIQQGERFYHIAQPPPSVEND